MFTVGTRVRSLATGSVGAIFKSLVLGIVVVRWDDGDHSIVNVEALAESVGVRCPACGSYSWLRVEDGQEHSEDLIDTERMTAQEVEDDHHDTNTSWVCFGCKAECPDELLDDVSEAFTSARWPAIEQAREAARV